MSIVKQFENITIQEFEEQYRDDVLNFELSERQQIYSSLPKSVLEDALKDENLSLIHISEPTRLSLVSRMPSSA